jgi:hypothetical protein
MRGRLFMSREHMFYAAFKQGVVKVQQHPAGVAEHDLHAFLFKGLNQ